MKSIVIEIKVEDELYEKAIELVVTSLFVQNAWLPGFLFQSWFSSWSLNLERMRDQNVRMATGDEPHDLHGSITSHPDVGR